MLKLLAVIHEILTASKPSTSLERFMAPLAIVPDLRELVGLTQTDIATISGTTQSAVAEIEALLRGRKSAPQKSIQVNTLVAYLSAIGIEIDPVLIMKLSDEEGHMVATIKVPETPPDSVVINRPITCQVRPPSTLGASLARAALEPAYSSTTLTIEPPA